MEISKEAAYCAKCIPIDSKLINGLSSNAYISSRTKEPFCSKRVIAPASLIASIALAIFQIPIYALRSFVNVTLSFLTLNSNKEFVEVGNNIKNVFSLCKYTLLTITLTFASILKPTWACSHYKPPEFSPKKPKLSPELVAANAKVVKGEEEIEALAKKLADLEKTLPGAGPGSGADADGVSSRVAQDETLVKAQAELDTLRTQIETAKVENIAKIEALKEAHKNEIGLLGVEGNGSGKEDLVATKQTETISRLQDELKQKEIELEKVKTELLTHPSSPTPTEIPNVKLIEIQTALATAQESLAQAIVNHKTEITTLTLEHEANVEGLLKGHEEAIKALEIQLTEAPKTPDEIAQLTEEIKQLQTKLENNDTALKAAKDASTTLLETTKAGLEEQLEASDLEKQRLEGILEELNTSAEAMQKSALAAEILTHSKTGAEVSTIVLNGVVYRYSCNQEDPESIVQAEKLRNFIRRFRTEHESVAISVLSSLGKKDLDGRVLIELTGLEPNVIPDVTKMEDAASDAILNDRVKSWLSTITDFIWDENHCPSKLAKYDSVMQDMNEKCSHLFSSGWHDEFCEDALTTEMKDLESFILYDAVPGKFKNSRERYQRFGALLDVICLKLQNEKYNHNKKTEIEELINEIVKVRWKEVSQDGFYEGLVHHVREAYHKVKGLEYEPNQAYTMEKFAEELIEINGKEVKDAPTYVKKDTKALLAQKAGGEVGGENFTQNKSTIGVRSNDTIEDTNGVSQEIRYVRHGCPTSGKFYSFLPGMVGKVTGIGSRWTGEEVVPNYIQFIKALEKDEEAAFIVTHQQLDEGPETARVVAVQNLEKTHENCAVLVQPIGQGNLGTKAGKYKDANTFKQLSDAIIENFFNPKEEDSDFKRCQLPSFILEEADAYKKATKDMLLFIEDTFFAEGTDFGDINNWQSLLLIFFTFQKIDLMMRFQEHCGKRISYHTTFCKDFLDRGGIVALTHSSILALITDQFDKHEWMASQVRHVVGPPIGVKRQEMIPKKLAIYEHLHRHLVIVQKNETGKLDALKRYQFAGKWHFTGHTTLERPNQMAIQQIQKIRTLDEMKERLCWMQQAGQEEKISINNCDLLAEVIKALPEVPIETRVILDGKDSTIEQLPTTYEDKWKNLNKVLSLSMNGILETAREGLKKALSREEDGLALSEPKNLSFEITTAENTLSISIRHDYDYTAGRNISEDGTGRFVSEGVKEGHVFATVQSAFAISYDLDSEVITKNGSFKWKVQEVK